VEEKDNDILDLQKRFLDLIMPDSFPDELKTNMREYIYFRKELTSESERGCALLAASHLDFLLEKVLKVKLIGSNKLKKQLFDFNGPLGTFSSRILMAYSLGLISEIRLNDLQTIRKIRNDFGHSPSIISFEDEKIKSLCNNLNLCTKSNKTSRSKFTTSVSWISGGLMALVHKEKPFEPNEEIDIQKVKNTSEEFRNLVTEIMEIEKDKSK